MNNYLIFDIFSFSRDLEIYKFIHSHSYPPKSPNLSQWLKNRTQEFKQKMESASIPMRRNKILESYGPFIFLKNENDWFNAKLMLNSFLTGLYANQYNEGIVDFLPRHFLHDIIGIIMFSYGFGNLVDLIDLFEIYLETYADFSPHAYMEANNMICRTNDRYCETERQLWSTFMKDSIHYLINKLLEKQVETYQNLPPHSLFEEAPGPINGPRKRPYPTELEYMRFDYEQSQDLKDFHVTKSMLSHVHCWICNPSE